MSFTIFERVVMEPMRRRLEGVIEASSTFQAIYQCPETGRTFKAPMSRERPQPEEIDCRFHSGKHRARIPAP